MTMTRINSICDYVIWAVQTRTMTGKEAMAVLQGLFEAIRDKGIVED